MNMQDQEVAIKMLKTFLEKEEPLSLDFINDYVEQSLIDSTEAGSGIFLIGLQNETISIVEQVEIFDGEVKRLNVLKNYDIEFEQEYIEFPLLYQAWDIFNNVGDLLDGYDEDLEDSYLIVNDEKIYSDDEDYFIGEVAGQKETLNKIKNEIKQSIKKVIEMLESQKSIKQTIVIRKDLKMRRGKESAQACHASMKVFFDLAKISETKKMTIPLTPQMEEWVNGVFTKICVSVDSEEELLEIYECAKEANLPVALIQDIGKTEFDGVPTYTCLAIGPANSEDIDKITGKLKLR